MQNFWLFEERIGLPVVSFEDMPVSTPIPGTYGGAIYDTVDYT